MSAFTSVANRLLVVMVYITDCTLTTPTMTGGGFSWVLKAYQTVGPNTHYIFYAKVSGAVSTTITVDVTGDAGSSCFMDVFHFTGYDAVTPDPFRQVFFSTSSTTSADPSVTFALPLATGNGYGLKWSGLGATAGISTPPTGWTERGDLTVASPTGNASSAYRAGGETTAGPFTFVSASTTWVALGFEIYDFGTGPVGGTTEKGGFFNM